MSDTDNLPTVQQMHADSLREALAERADGLRRIADDFDILAREVDHANDYVMLADRAVHDLAWGVANLGMERVVREAAGGQIARAKGD